MRAKIQSVINATDFSTFPIKAHFSVSNCGTKVSCALETENLEARPGFWRRLFGRFSAPIMGIWPPHSVRPASDSVEDILYAQKAATLSALGHEFDEHMKHNGKLVNDPHPKGPSLSVDEGEL